MDTQEKLIRLCCEQIERTLSWGNAQRWSNQDFERLSELIAEKSKIKLSVSTLKRVWGKVQYDSLPSDSTLNALAQLAGFENWRDFRQKNFTPGETVKQTSQVAWWQKPQLRKMIFMLTLIVFGLVAFLVSRMF